VTGSKSLHRRFLGGKTTGEMNGGDTPRGTVGDLTVGEDAVQESLAVPLDGVGNPVDVSRVEPEADDIWHDRLYMKPQLASGFAWVSRPGGPVQVCRPLEAVASHFYTTRPWALGSSNPEPTLASAWDEVARAIGVAPDRLARMRQVHGASVVVSRATDVRPDSNLPPGDIVMTDDPTIAIAIQTADCVPILMADLRTGAVAAAHAGWRGLVAGVPGVAVVAMSRHFTTRPADLVVALGPSISADCYEVGEDVRRAFEKSRSFDRLDDWFPRTTRAGHWLFDGWRSVRDQLVQAGVRPDRVHGCELCTFMNATVCCSYRRDGKAAGRMAAAIRARQR
jgi:YfiH family protein